MLSVEYRGRPLQDWSVDEIGQLADEEPWSERSDGPPIPGPLRGLHRTMEAFGASRVGDLGLAKVLANAVLLGVLTLEEAQALGEADS